MPDASTGPRMLGTTNRTIAHDSDKELRLVLTWKRPFSVILFAFSVGWNIAILVGLVGWGMSREHNLLILGFLVVDLILGAVVTYVAMAMLRNKTVVQITADTFRVWHGPIRWPGELQLDARDIVQVSHVDRPSSRRLRVLVKGGKIVDVIDGLGEPHQARFIQFQVERRLGMIKTCSVTDEELAEAESANPRPRSARLVD